jgi:hypothetical protein
VRHRCENQRTCQSFSLFRTFYRDETFDKPNLLGVSPTYRDTSFSPIAKQRACRNPKRKENRFFEKQANQTGWKKKLETKVAKLYALRFRGILFSLCCKFFSRLSCLNIRLSGKVSLEVFHFALSGMRLRSALPCFPLASYSKNNQVE